MSNIFQVVTAKYQYFCYWISQHMSDNGRVKRHALSEADSSHDENHECSRLIHKTTMHLLAC